jgi:hypothetical protein
MAPLLHFLLIYNVDEHELIAADDLGRDTDAAVEKYAACEREYRDQPGIEIVLIGADSLDTVKQTHSHYFPGDLGAEFFESVGVS